MSLLGKLFYLNAINIIEIVKSIASEQLNVMSIVWIINCCNIQGCNLLYEDTYEPTLKNVIHMNSNTNLAFISICVIKFQKQKQTNVLDYEYLLQNVLMYHYSVCNKLNKWQNHCVNDIILFRKIKSTQKLLMTIFSNKKSNLKTNLHLWMHI